MTAAGVRLLGGDGERAAGYGPLAQLPERNTAGLAGMLSGDAAPNSRLVADAIVRLIAAPAGTRPLRTVVDAHPEDAEATEQVCGQVQAGATGCMGLCGLLHVATRSQAS